MTNEQIIEIIEIEIKTKTLGVTEQYLEIHSPVYIDGKLQVARIDRNNPEVITVYLPVDDEKFYFTVFIDVESGEVCSFNTVANQRVYFWALSEKLSEKKLRAMTKLEPTESWKKGDIRKGVKLKQKYSSIIFMPNPEPAEFEEKLTKLLDFLEQDKEGIKRLVDEADGYIQVYMDFHNGNTMLGGPHIDLNSIKRMNDLNLEIDFDLYVSGNSFK
jgi:hypothetical protein